MALTALKNLFNRILHRALLFLDIPHCYSIDPDTFGKSEFPIRTFPVSVWDWRDIVEYLYTSPFVVGLHQVLEVGRYKFERDVDPGGEHQVVVVKVEVEKGAWRLLRIERDTVRGVLRVGERAFPKAQGEGYPPTRMNLSGSGLGSGSGVSSDATRVRAPSPPPATSTSPHPSLAIYSSPAAALHSDIFESSTTVKDEEKESAKQLENSNSKVPIDVDTVQSIFPPDLQKLICVESIQPRRLYLHHLAILVGEVHEYDCVKAESESRSSGGDQHRCTLFADLVMRAIEKEVGIPPERFEVAAVTNHIPPTNTPATSKEEAVSQILERYRRRRDEPGR